MPCRGIGIGQLSSPMRTLIHGTRASRRLFTSLRGLSRVPRLARGQRSMRDVYTTVVTGFFFPLHELLKGHSTVARLRALERSQWWDRARIEAEQIKRLRAFLQHTRAHVPFYRRIFDEARFDPDRVQVVTDLKQLPLLTKSI